MRYTTNPGQYCSKCRTDSFAFNRFGYCAACWSKASDDERIAIAGDLPARYVTIHHPTPRMRTAVLLSVLASVAVTTVCNHWSQIAAFVARIKL